MSTREEVQNAMNDIAEKRSYDFTHLSKSIDVNQEKTYNNISDVHARSSIYSRIWCKGSFNRLPQNPGERFYESLHRTGVEHYTSDDYGHYISTMEDQVIFGVSRFPVMRANSDGTISRSVLELVEGHESSRIPNEKIELLSEDKRNFLGTGITYTQEGLQRFLNTHVMRVYSYTYLEQTRYIIKFEDGNNGRHSHTFCKIGILDTSHANWEKYLPKSVELSYTSKEEMFEDFALYFRFFFGGTPATVPAYHLRKLCCNRQENRFTESYAIFNQQNEPIYSRSGYPALYRYSADFNYFQTDDEVLKTMAFINMGVYSSINHVVGRYSCTGDDISSRYSRFSEEIHEFMGTATELPEMHEVNVEDVEQEEAPPRELTPVERYKEELDKIFIDERYPEKVLNHEERFKYKIIYREGKFRTLYKSNSEHAYGNYTALSCVAIETLSPASERERSRSGIIKWATRTNYDCATYDTVQEAINSIVRFSYFRDKHDHNSLRDIAILGRPQGWSSNYGLSEEEIETKRVIIEMLNEYLENPMYKSRVTSVLSGGPLNIETVQPEERSRETFTIAELQEMYNENHAELNPNLGFRSGNITLFDDQYFGLKHIENGTLLGIEEEHVVREGRQNRRYLSRNQNGSGQLYRLRRFKERIEGDMDWHFILANFKLNNGMREGSREGISAHMFNYIGTRNMREIEIVPIPDSPDLYYVHACGHRWNLAFSGTENTHVRESDEVNVVDCSNTVRHASYVGSATNTITDEDRDRWNLKLTRKQALYLFLYIAMENGLIQLQGEHQDIKGILDTLIGDFPADIDKYSINNGSVYDTMPGAFEVRNDGRLRVHTSDTWNQSAEQLMYMTRDLFHLIETMKAPSRSYGNSGPLTDLLEQFIQSYNPPLHGNFSNPVDYSMNNLSNFGCRRWLPFYNSDDNEFYILLINGGDYEYRLSPKDMLRIVTAQATCTDRRNEHCFNDITGMRNRIETLVRELDSITG